LGLSIAARIDSFKVCRRTKNPRAFKAGECQLAIETLVKAISEVEGVFWQPTPEVDTSGLNDGSLHLIVRYWTLRQPQVRRTKTRLWWRLK